jgi:membrane associated rhomboid family serine protease
MNEFYLTDAVKNLLIINVLAFFAFLTVGANYYHFLGLYDIENPNFRAYQLVTHFFMHSNYSFTHILFNMYGLANFGVMLELVWKTKRFLFFYLFCGIGAGLFQLLVHYIQAHFFEVPVSAIMTVGASGALYGVMIAFAMMRPYQEMRMLFIPIPMQARYLVGIYIALDFFQGFGGFQTGVAHFAHLGGALSGALLVLYWRYFGSNL